MNTLFETRQQIMEKIYALYSDYAAGFSLACHKGCDLCCTANVTTTTLEAMLVMNYWQAQGQSPPNGALQAAARRTRFQPMLTINAIAALCVQNKDIPEEAADPGAGPCPLLQDGCCTIYPARPFGCRAMVSRSRCLRGGAAEMPDEVLSVNHIIMQCIEAIDIPGWSGNLTDVLLWLSDPRRGGEPEAGKRGDPPQCLTANQTIAVLMVPPEHRTRLQPLIQKLTGLIRELKK